jgi:hypothetical protein
VYNCLTLFSTTPNYNLCEGIQGCRSLGGQICRSRACCAEGISWLILARICLRLEDKGEWVRVCTPQDLSLTSNDRISAYVNTIGLGNKECLILSPVSTLKDTQNTSENNDQIK